MILQPPSRMIGDWLQFSGGDLFIFTVAMAACFDDLKRCRWGLDPESVKNYLRYRYLELMPEKSQRVLNEIILLTGMRLVVPETLFEQDALADPVCKELLFFKKLPGQKAPIVRLAHPGIARFLYHEMEESEKLALFEKVAQKDSSFGLRLSAELGDTYAAKIVLSKVFASQDWSSWVKFYNDAEITTLTRTLAKMIRLQVAKVDEVDRRLAVACRALEWPNLKPIPRNCKLSFSRRW